MSGCCEFIEIADRSVKDISRRVARLEMCEQPAGKINPSHGKTLMVTVKGDYELAILFYAENRVLSAIAENMKRSLITSEEEITAYTMEFFNILCGHVVSSYNRLAHLSARFRIPEFVTGPVDPHHPIRGGDLQELCYHCPYGTAKLQAVCFP